MQINFIVCPKNIEQKIEAKHHVSLSEARQAILNNPRIRFAEKGFRDGENVYVAFGQTFVGRYLAVFFIDKPKSTTALIISARDMSAKERKTYGKK